MSKKSRSRVNSLQTEDSKMVGVPDIMKSVAEDGQLSVDFLMPNGIIIPMKVNFYHSLDLLKQNVWKEAEEYPHYDLLNRSEFYNFVIITTSGEKEEILDENQSLDDIRPFMAFLKLVEKEGDEQEKTLSHHIHTLIERVGPGQKVEAWHSAEVSDFRTRMQQLCSKVNQERLGQNWLERLKYKHPPRLRSFTDLPKDIKERLDNDRLVVNVRVYQTDFSYRQVVDIGATPRDLIRQVLKEMRQRENFSQDDVDCHILKVGGLEEYIFGDKPLTQFEYVYKCIIQDVAPHFWLMHAEVVTDMAPPVAGRRRSISPGTQPETRSTTSVWDINERYYLNVSTISKLQFGEGKKVQLFMGVFHGSDALCSVKTTDDLPVRDGQVIVNKEFEFDISVADLPPMARLCFMLYLSGGGGKKGNRDLVPQAWVNIPIFDFRSRLMSGKRDLNMWQIMRDLQTDERCYPIGCVTPNHLGFDSVVLSIFLPEFDKFTVVYPSCDKVFECAAENMKIPQVSKSHLDQLQEIVSRETSQLFEQDIEILWLTRVDCRDHYHTALPVLLKAVKWNNHVDVCMMVALLQTWPQCPLEVALQLLDFDYPDRTVRKQAVEWLDKILTDEELSLYMLQLVQALKYETHLYNPLVEFLLKRCLKNLHLGHQFFWLLKSEINNPVVSVQNGIILEVYLTSSRAHLTELVRQNEALRKLKALCAITNQQKADTTKGEHAYEDMRKVLRQKTFMDALSKLPCPLTPLLKLDSLSVGDCRFMNSKKKPLWLEWKNADAIGDNVLLLFKKGDDLRQDMLTLQMLQIMDSIWQAEGLDLRMNAYRCVATCVTTGDEQGMIEVVTRASTIAKIMQNSVLDKKVLFEWLQEKNNTPEKLRRAVEEFMLSCAGYCVATYVLGIGDRHNDNIMLKENGQLFHIDFGHILGNFKSKLGIRRERVPFVLTTHFVYIMEKGGQNFKSFEDTCVKAYLSLRRKSTLFISLFRLMLQSGMPELTAQKDVDYLRQTLLPHVTEEEALKHFKSKLKDALKNSWTTMVNFKVHMMAKK